MNFELESIPTYTINLAIPPHLRWIPLIKKYKKILLESYDNITSIIKNLNNSNLSSIKLWLIEKTIYLPGESPVYYQELKSIADELHFPLNRLIILQVCYECFSTCTSIIWNDNSKLSYPIHIRIMDWNDKILKALTVNIRFMDGNKHIFDAISWVGYVGVLTGVKPNICSVSVNYRQNDNPQFWKHIWNTFSLKYPIGYLVRETLTNCDGLYTIVDIFEKTKLIAPCYIILTGMTNHTGKIIVRDIDSYITYPINNYEKYISQTNIDPSNGNVEYNILKSLERDDKAKMLCNNFPSKFIKNNIINSYEIAKYFLQEPILNEDNIYISILSPTGPNIDTYLNKSWVIYKK